MYDKRLIGYVIPEYGLGCKKNSNSTAPSQRKFCIARIEKSSTPPSLSAAPQKNLPENMNQSELERLLREFGNGYITGIRADTRVPVALQAKLRLDMQGVNDAMSADLANIAETSFADDAMPSAVWERAAPMIQHGAGGISSVVGENDQTFRQYLALKDLERVGCKRFLYVSENGKAACGTCGSHHGKAYSMRELEALGMIPPVHQSCKCALIALDTAAENSYNLNRQKFVSDAQENLGRHSGGIYRSKRNFSRGGFSFTPVKISTYPAVTDGSAAPKWYDGLRDWAVDFGKDAKSFWNAFCNGFAQRDQNKLNSVPGFLDWLTAGIVSGAFAANAGRYEAAFRDPTLYNIVNFVSSGAVGTVNGAVNPEKPLSFEHWMSSLETAMLAYSAYKTVEQAAALRAAPNPPASDKPMEVTEKPTSSDRNIAGSRQSAFHELTENEIVDLKEQIKLIDADERVFRFNEGGRTGYRDADDFIYVKGDTLRPEWNSNHPRDMMSERAVLAHEYYGHRVYRGTRLPNGSWNDEFRASYMAAKNAPGLSMTDRRYLMLDAIERAKEAGVTINYNEFMRRTIDGF